MFKSISLSLGALAIVAAALSMALPERAQARTCKATYIPSGYSPTTQTCGSVSCRGVIWENRYGLNPICVIVQDEI